IRAGQSFPATVERIIMRIWSATLLGLVMCGIFLESTPMRPSTVAAADDIWAGALDIGGQKLRMVLHLSSKPDGTYTSTLDSPDQMVKGIVVAKTTLSGGRLVLDVASVSGKFEGTLSPDGKEIVGVWEQGGAKLPLTLKKTDKAPEVAPP